MLYSCISETFSDHNLIIYKNNAKDVISQILNLSLQS